MSWATMSGASEQYLGCIIDTPDHKSYQLLRLNIHASPFGGSLYRTYTKMKL